MTKKSEIMHYVIIPYDSHGLLVYCNGKDPQHNDKITDSFDKVTCYDCKMKLDARNLSDYRGLDETRTNADKRIRTYRE